MIKKICDHTSLQEFVARVDGLHDAILRELAWRGRAWVDEFDSMHNDTSPPSVQMIFQSQFKDITAVRLSIGSVKMFRFNPTFELELEGSVDGDVFLYLSGKENADECLIVGSDVEYELLDPTHRGARFSLTSPSG